MASPPPTGFSTVSVTSSGWHPGKAAGGEATAGRRPVFQDDEVFGDYRIVRLLGTGGMGEVYTADDLVSGRRVALKVVNVAKSSPLALQRFLREGQLAAALSHPNTVYVFASGESAGIPYIVSEFVPGGTLADRVNTSGPLPVSQAVDAILDVIAGLDAAARLGIIHRDVKPANCFVLADGGVKVGDFGISIPLDARERTELTQSGAIVGTPSYCAPEQLKGEPLDVRADIYSVGATLFYLLVGHPPYRASDLVSLIEQVLIAPPPSPRQYRREIPTQLDHVVTGCLGKARDTRPARYDELAAALRPFSSASPSPAPVAPRALAAVLDGLLLVVLWNLTAALINVLPGAADLVVPWARVVVRTLVTVAYFALQEYWLGASLGKRLCGLRVGSADGARVGFWPSVARAGIVFAALSVPTQVSVGFGLTFTMSPGPNGLVVALLLFVTARRANGYSGIHELLTGTRTWEGPSSQSARAAVATSQPALDSPTSSESMGPYRIVHRMPGDPALVLARDERLRRDVWLRLASNEDPQVSPARRDLDRPTRFRWLGARRSATDSWDAYEHVDGRPFLSIETEDLSFQTVARWLASLARECRAAAADGTLAAVGLDRLWLSRSGDLRVADWPLPDADAGERNYQTVDAGDCQRFLADVAARARQGVPGRDPLPVYGSALLDALQRGSFVTVDDLVAACDSAAIRDGVLSRPRRVAPIVAVSVVAAVPLIAVLLQAPGLSLSQLHFRQVGHLGLCLERLELLSQGAIADAAGVRRDAAEMCVALAGRDMTGSLLNGLSTRFPRATARIGAARAKYPRASPADVQARLADLPPSFDFELFRPEGAFRIRTRAAADLLRAGVDIGIRLLAGLGAASVALTLLLGEAPLYWILGIAIVRADGSRVTRARACARALVVWLPAFVAVLVLPPQSSADTWRTFAAAIPIIPMATAAIYAARHPSRGAPERLTGTRLVRR